MLKCADCGSTNVVAAATVEVAVQAIVTSDGPTVARLAQEHRLSGYKQVRYGALRVTGDLNVGSMERAVRKCGRCLSTNLLEEDICPSCGHSNSNIVYCTLYKQFVCNKCMNMSTCNSECKNVKCPLNGRRYGEKTTC